MRKITVTLNGVSEQPQRRDPPGGGIAAVIGLAIILLALSATDKENVRPPHTPASLAVDRTVLRFPGPGPQIIHLRNTGDEPLTIRPPSLKSVSFRIASDCKKPLRKDESCVVSVVMRPNARPNGTAKLRIASDGGNEMIELIASITPLPPVEMQPLDFGRRILGTAGKPAAVHFTNSASGTVSLGAAKTAAPFHIVDDICHRRPVAAGRGCDVVVTFDPTTAGLQTGEVRIPTSGGRLAAFAPLLGRAVAPLSQIRLDPVSFGRQPVGKTSKARLVQLINSTNVPLSLSRSVTDPPFRVVSDGCKEISLQRTSRCNVLVEFSPVADGEQKGEVRISNTDGAIIGIGPLSGIGITQTPPPIPHPQLTLQPVDFGSLPIGALSAVRTVRMVNTSQTTLSLGPAEADAPFKVLQDCRNGQLASGSPCDILVSFSPTAQGSVTGELRATASDGYIIARGTLAGEGTLLLDQPPRITVDKRQVNFKGRPGSERIIVSNRGPGSVAIQVSVETKPYGYAIDASQCTSAALAPKNDCPISVTANEMAIKLKQTARIDIVWAGHTDSVDVSAW